MESQYECTDCGNAYHVNDNVRCCKLVVRDICRDCGDKFDNYRFSCIYEQTCDYEYACRECKEYIDTAYTPDDSYESLEFDFDPYLYDSVETDEPSEPIIETVTNVAKPDVVSAAPAAGLPSYM